jgi:glycosyltransferase involved in cell wall biosynthesis
MSTPSVAVVIPSYNHSRYIAEAIASVFRQTQRPQHLLVIDDGSTDDSLATIQRVFDAAPPIRCSLTTRANRGISATRNELCAAADADFVAFLDSDDVYAPERLRRMLAGAPRRGNFFAFSGVTFLDERGHDRLGQDDTYSLRLGQGTLLPTAGFALLRNNIAISASNLVISRGLFDTVGGFDERIRICQDWDFALRALRFVEPTFVPEPLLTYRLHAHNTSGDGLKSSAWERELVVDKLCAWMGESTPNSRAPTPRNWPRYFRLFAHLSMFAGGQPLASRLPRELLAPPSEPLSTARETRAIHDLLTAARSAETFEGLAREDLMIRCAQAWANRD